MEIKSSLINDEDFKYVKDSLIATSEIDGKQDFRVRTLEYINDSADNDNDMFFYDMLEFVRFLDPHNKEDIAYTTPDHLIYLNCPGILGEKIRQWDFIYDHECLHQLWDTFAVGDKIKEKHGEDKYDHKLLNYASDCVINDYLSYYRKKDMPDNLISPDYINKKFGVKYDRKVDTQYTLYLKLLKKIEEVKKDPNYQSQPDEGEGEGDGQSQNMGPNQDQNQGKSQNKGKGEGQSQDNKESNTAKDAEKSANEAKDAADRAKKAADKAEANGDKDADKKKKAADKAKEAADETKKAADKAKEAADKGDKEGEEKAAKKAKEAADKAKAAANEAEGKETDNNDDAQSGKPGEGHEEGKLSDEELDKIKKTAEKIIDKYKSKLSGDLGTFVTKCKKSLELKESGLAVNTSNGVSGWNQQMNVSINAFVKKKVFQKKRQYQQTYSRIKRGSGFVKFGEPIKPGKKVKEEKLTINVAFYIDRSGSMGSSIDNVFKALYIIAESLKKQFSRENVVESVSFKIYAFDTSMQEIPFGKKTTAGGGTMGFHEILKFIKDHTKEYLINVIITDAEFNIDVNETDKFIKDVDGMIEFITNTENLDMKKLAKKYENQLNYILANSDFTLNK